MGAWHVMTSATSGHERPGEQEKVSWALADPAHDVWPPVGSEREIDPDRDAVVSQFALPGRADAVEEFDLVLAWLPAVRPGEPDDLAGEYVIVCPEGGVEAC